MQHLKPLSACVPDLKNRARKRIPGFAFDYVEGGCNHEAALHRNRQALDAVQLRADYLAPYSPPDLSTTLFGQDYAAPFGIAPLGLTGIVWPNASLMHARAAKKANIPYVLSTLSTSSIEDAAACAEDNFWFQLYPPSDLAIRADLIKRAADTGCKNLIVTIDVAAAGHRPKDIKNGLAIPPKITPRSVFQSALRPQWSIATLKAGLPQFASILPYMKDLSNIQDVANYVRNTLKDVVDEPMLRTIRDSWQGNLIVKGINHADDALRAVAAGADGLIVSNHGGRQLDAAEASINTIESIKAAVPEHIVVMADSGVESGVDIARFLAQGASTVFSGRAFLYGVAAHGEAGAEHTIDILRDELQQVMSQLHCTDTSQIQRHKLNRNTE
ncbi:alpha-hydroxy acid oxidase [Leucothrix pacifica]|uniref:alpha-hydroxy acid oxidase n=1 Tax=Leucothrix pacifica TaxID=1247513 RepID=UPI0015E8596F|nr:alpha-hydroxy acid oxidase [Leucothrix pacifica]